MIMNYSQGHLKKSTTLTSPESKKILMITLVLVRTPTARQNRPFSGQTFVVQQFMHVKWIVASSADISGEVTQGRHESKQISWPT